MTTMQRYRDNTGRHYIHQFGTEIPRDRKMLAADVLPLAFPRTDGAPGHWDVEETPCAAMVNGSPVVIDGYKSLVRSDNHYPLSIVSDGYAPLTVADSFSAFDPWVEAGIIRYDIAGPFHKGRRIWILATLNVPALDIGAGDVSTAHVLLANTFDRSSSVIVKPTGQRERCSNALRLALLDGLLTLRVQHRGDVAGNTRNAVASIDGIRIACERQAEVYRAMAAAPAVDHDVARYVAAVYRKPLAEVIGDGERTAPMRVLGPIAAAWDNPAGGQCSTTDGTVWGLYQALTQVLTHGAAGSRASESRRAESLLFNGAAEIMDRGEVVAEVLASIGISKSSGLTWDDVIASPTPALRAMVADRRSGATA